MLKTLKAITLAGMLALFPVQQAQAAEVQNVMDDALYGAGIGALVGIGLMLLTDKPSDNWDFISRGVGIGIIAGAGYGVYRSGRAFAEVEDGQIHLGMPSPEFAFRETPEGLDLVVQTNFIRGSF